MNDKPSEHKLGRSKNLKVVPKTKRVGKLDIRMQG